MSVQLRQQWPNNQREPQRAAAVAAARLTLTLHFYYLSLNLPNPQPTLGDEAAVALAVVRLDAQQATFVPNLRM